MHKNLRQLHFWEEVFFLYYTSKYCTKIWGNSIFGRKFFSYTTQVKVFTKFWGNSIFGRKLGSFFSYTTQVKVCTKFWSNSIFGRKYFFLYYTSKSLPKILNQLHFCRKFVFSYAIQAEMMNFGSLWAQKLFSLLKCFQLLNETCNPRCAIKIICFEAKFEGNP